MRPCSHRSFATIVCFLGLSVLGLCLLPSVSVSEREAGQSPRSIIVSFSMDGQPSPAAVESSVTAPLEGALGRVAGVSHIYSRSHTGGGEVSLSFDGGADIDAARLEVSSIVRRIWEKMPPQAGYPSIAAQRPGGVAVRPFMVYTLSSPGSAAQLYGFASRRLRPELARIAGIGNIAISPEAVSSATVTYSPEKLREYGLVPDDIRQAVSRGGSRFLGYASDAATGGKSAHKAVFLVSRAAKAGDIGNAVVRHGSAGNAFPLRSIARVETAGEDARSRMRINGENAVTVSLYARMGENQVRLGKRVRGYMAKAAAAMPKGYKLRLTDDSSQSVAKEARDVSLRSALSVALLLLSVFLFNRNRRLLLVVAAATVANVAISFAVFWLAGVEIQVFSIAGIAISIGMVAANVLIMADHLLYRGTLGFFTAILASTLTTLVALAAVALLGEGARLALADFAEIMAVNLAVSLGVCLLLVPALMDALGVRGSGRTPVGRLRKIAKLNKSYAAFAAFSLAHRKWAAALTVLAFGIPVFLLPAHIDGETLPCRLYNATLGSKLYGAVRQFTDVALGGALRPYMMRTVDRGYDSSEPSDGQSLTMEAYLPDGSSLAETDSAVSRMEAMLLRQPGISTVTTDFSAGRGGIACEFTPEGKRRGMPAKVYSLAVREASAIGNANWTVRGGNRQFSNIIGDYYRHYHITLSGYNYDRLMDYADTLSQRLLRGHARMGRLQITPYGYGDYGGGREEFVFSPHRRLLAAAGGSAAVFPAIMTAMPQPIRAGDVSIVPEGSAIRNYFDVANSPTAADGHSVKPAGLLAIARRQAPGNIVRRDQSYLLSMGYDYTGDHELASRISKREVEAFNRSVPKGYGAQIDEWDGRQSSAQFPFAAFAIAIAAIYIVAAILLNSLALPAAAVSVMPFSLIGLFIGYTLAGTPSGYGSIMAFLLIGGLTCNAVIYILNDYRAFRRQGLPPPRAYLKAFNGKIVPVVLTVVSTAASFLPFMIESPAGSFWMSVSVGTVSGLVMSIVGLVVFVPALCGLGREKRL